MTVNDSRLGYKEVVEVLQSIDTSLGCICIVIGVGVTVLGVIGYFLILR